MFDAIRSQARPVFSFSSRMRPEQGACQRSLRLSPLAVRPVCRNRHAPVSQARRGSHWSAANRHAQEVLAAGNQGCLMRGKGPRRWRKPHRSHPESAPGKRGGRMSDSDDMKLCEELLNLLAEEQSSPKDTPTANDVDRREYRCQRIQELVSRLRVTDEANSR